MTEGAKSTKKAESTGRQYSPQELADRTKFADPALTNSYAIAKNQLWAKYNATYAPAFQEFRNNITNAVLLMGKDGAKAYSTAIKRLVAARNKYLKTAREAFTEYIEDLTKAYTADKIETHNIDLSKMRAAAAKIKPAKKPKKKSRAKSKKVAKPRPKRASKKGGKKV